MTGLCLRFLGPAEVSHAGTVVEFNIAKVQAMLAYLAITGLPQRREHLLDLLWSESHPEAARKNLRNSLWRTRRALGDDVLMAEGDTIMLSTSVWVDAVAFETGIQAQFAQAVPDPAQILSLSDLWRGPLLAEINLPDAPGFDLWLIGERERNDRSLEINLRQSRAEARIAGFFVLLMRRLKRLGYDATSLPLPMSRTDLANHLGLTLECLSRELGKWKKAGVIATEKAVIRLIKPEELSTLACHLS